MLAQSLSTESIPTPVSSALADYSSYLSTGKTADSSGYSTAMQVLVDDRRNFYKDFVETGLNLNFVKVESQFDTATIIDKVQGNVHYLEVTEDITLYGTSKISSAEDYPLVQSARWAIANTSDPFVLEALNNYLSNMLNSVNESIVKGATIKTILKHNIVIVSDKQQTVITQDRYNDKSIEDVTGTDVIDWSNNGFSRNKYDWTTRPDYLFFHTPVEELGKSLLADYTNTNQSAVTTNKTDTTVAATSYSHSNGVYYANIYTFAATTSQGCTNGVLYQNWYYWNLSYTKYLCNDCANYISQALKYGGYATDGTWTPGSTAWINSVSLENYLVTTNKLYFVCSLANMQPGDIAWREDLGHVVMYVAVNPARYDGHSNDRKNKNWDASLTKYGVLH